MCPNPRGQPSWVGVAKGPIFTGLVGFTAQWQGLHHSLLCGLWDLLLLKGHNMGNPDKRGQKNTQTRSTLSSVATWAYQLPSLIFVGRNCQGQQC